MVCMWIFLDKSHQLDTADFCVIQWPVFADYKSPVFADGLTR